MIKYCLLLLSWLLISACGTNDLVEHQAEDIKGTTFISNDPKAVYERGGYVYDPTLNPYAQNNLYPLSDEERNAALRSDVNRARLVILEKTDFETGPISINGNRMWVTVYDHRLMKNNKEKIQKEALVHKHLSKAFPNYNIEVKMEEKHR
ncbi:hypothetical protein [Peribacillus tepidiphilus]|jgi:hypothetical protein|uniref:hypothetical protein n=1 Tax=Peribacillus tepidiphilus TaxID=2652445 RepID=UPI001290CF5D|nr:hypothetical protein [Peribacillus tepidiphilus]